MFKPTNSTFCHRTTFLFLIFLFGCGLESWSQVADSGESRPLSSLYDVEGQRYNLKKIPGLKAVVLAWTSEGCPMSKTYSPRLVEIAKAYEEQGAKFFVVDSSPQDSPSSMRTWAKNHQADIPLIFDQGGKLARTLGVTRTTEVLLFDAQLNLRYRGAIDDQYGFKRSPDPKTGKVGTYRKEAPTRNYLKDGLDVVIPGQERALPSTEAWGCAIGTWPNATKQSSDAPTFYTDIQPILENRCNECHHKGGSAPFSLQSYKRAAGWGDTILEVIDAGAMPPWNANPKHGNFKNARILLPEEKKTIRDWVNSGTPEGNKDSKKPTRVYQNDWEIGEPDLVLKAPDFAVPPAGLLTYQYYRVKKVFEKDTWVKAAQVRSSNADVVHHVLCFLETPRGRSKELFTPYRPRTSYRELLQGASKDEQMLFLRKAREAQFAKPSEVGEAAGKAARSAGYRQRMFTSRENGLLGYFLSSLPGRDVRIFGDEKGKFIPAGSRMVFQFHFTPNGLPTKTSTELGLKFFDEAPKEVIQTQSLATLALKIPAGEENYVREVRFKLPRDGKLLSLHPHMHYRGKSFRYEVERPDGSTEILLDVPHYDFDWQHEYRLAKPLKLEAGSILKGRAVYDNSDQNPYNPNPKEEVYFGLQSTEEMYVGYYSIVWSDKKDAKDKKEK